MTISNNITINGNDYLITLDQTNQISFYHVGTINDPWNMSSENTLSINNVGNVKNPIATMRKIFQEITNIVFREKMDFYYFVPSDEKRKTIYMKYLANCLNKEYSLQIADNKIYMFRSNNRE